MKRKFLMASALGLALQMGAVRRVAAVEQPEDNPSMEGHRHSGTHPGAMAERLKLSPDQKKLYEAAYKERHEKMKALKDEYAAKRKTLMDASDSKIAGILSADQKVEFAKMKAESEKRRDEFKARRKDRDDDRPEPSEQK